jgi:hypothetical protein
VEKSYSITPFWLFNFNLKGETYTTACHNLHSQPATQKTNQTKNQQPKQPARSCCVRQNKPQQQLNKNQPTPAQKSDSLNIKTSHH